MKINRIDRRRPRPGMISRVAASAAVCIAVVVAFCTLVALGRLSAAAAILLAFPAADLLLHITGPGRYLARHVGRGPTSHLLTGLWAIGIASVIVATDAPSVPVRLALAVAAGAAATAAVEWIAWARHPRSLAARGLPGLESRKPRAAMLDRALEWAVAIAQVAATIALMAPTQATGRAVSLGIVLVLYAIRAAVAVMLAAVRAFRGDPRLREAIADGVARYEPEVLVHFSGSVHTVYQLDQWMPYVASSGLRVLIVLRESETFEAVAGRYSIPSVYIRDFPDLDLVVPTVRAALYVNTGTKNNHLVRFDSITHIQIHHGDSDKPVSSSKTMRLYDHHFVAGPAGVERLRAAGVVSDQGAVSVVGRPQTRSVPSGTLAKPRRSVVYAPTWEGFHVDAPLCSLPTYGEPLARRLPKDLDFVARPHPLTGSADRSLRRALAGLRHAVARRGRAGRYVDPVTEDLATTLAGADLLITDVSSVLVDFLAADRPVIVTDVAGIGAEELHRMYPTTSWAGVLDPELTNLDALLDDAFTTDRYRDFRRAAATEYLGETTSPETAFHMALRGLVDRPGDQADRAPVDS